MMYVVTVTNDAGKVVFRSDPVNINAARGIAARKQRESLIGYYGPDGADVEVNLHMTSFRRGTTDHAV